MAPHYSTVWCIGATYIAHTPRAHGLIDKSLYAHRPSHASCIPRTPTRHAVTKVEARRQAPAAASRLRRDARAPTDRDRRRASGASGVCAVCAPGAQWPVRDEHEARTRTRHINNIKIKISVSASGHSPPPDFFFLQYRIPTNRYTTVYTTGTADRGPQNRRRAQVHTLRLVKLGDACFAICA